MIGSDMFCTLACRKTVVAKPELQKFCPPCPGSRSKLPQNSSVKLDVSPKKKGGKQAVV